jgi:hypothetical protein
VLADQQPLVAQHRRQVVVGQQEPADLPGRRDQSQRRPGDDPHLSKPGAHRVEQARVAVRRAGQPLSPARDHLQLQDLVALHPQPPGRGADAAHDQRAPDRQLQVVGEHRRCEPLGQCGRDHLAPGRPGVNDHPIVLDAVDGPEPPQVGHDAVADLPAAEHRVPLPLGRKRVPVRGGPPDSGGHVLLRRGE